MGKLFQAISSLDISDQRNFFRICVLSLFVGGLISIWLGADTNWDLRNYHLYNPFAFFNDKLTINLAPAGLQTYFNPLIDMPYYWLAKHVPAVIVGFLMGFLHAGNFILIALIARQLLSDLPTGDNYKIPLILALFGCLTANFSSAFGNTMGDIITALLLLSSLLIALSILVRTKYAQAVGIKPWLLSGFLAGLAVGLKLTNAVFAVGLCASFMVLPFAFYTRLKLIIVFGIAVLAGLALTGGYWFYELWLQFGNPLFPQFSGLFPNELTRSISVADVRWGPRSIFDAILWPFILSLNPLRVGELNHHQIIWAIFYSLVLAWIVYVFIAKGKRASTSFLSPAEKYIIAFICISFVVWTKLFSIQRYLVAIEILTPLAIFLILTHIFPYNAARKYSMYLLSLSTFIVYFNDVKNWTHADWAWDMFSIELPGMEAPEKTTVIIAGGNPPFGWVAAQFPASVAFVQIDGNFPANPVTYSQRIDQILDARKGEIFALFQGEANSPRVERVAKLNKFLVFSTLAQSTQGCGYLRKLIPLLHVDKKIRLDSSSENSCYLTAINLAVPDNQTEMFYEHQAAQQLINYGFILDSSRCETYSAYIGQQAHKYRWCALGKRQ